jgi:hypothetical protein
MFCMKHAFHITNTDMVQNDDVISDNFLAVGIFRTENFTQKLPNYQFVI